MTVNSSLEGARGQLNFAAEAYAGGDLRRALEHIDGALADAKAAQRGILARAREQESGAD